MPDLVVYNASGRARGPFVDLVPDDVAQAISVSAFGGFLVAQQAAKRMLPKHHGAILFTGASASVKGYPQSAPFAMGKFALRGLAQSMARELSPQGIHVAHFVIDGGIRSAARAEPADRPDSMLDPDAIAAELLERVATAAQRLDLGTRIAAVGGEVLEFRSMTAPCPFGRHHPRKRMIQYSATPRILGCGGDYWIPAVAGMTAVFSVERGNTPHKGIPT